MAIFFLYLATFVFLAVFVGLRRFLQFLSKSKPPRLNQIRILVPDSVSLPEDSPSRSLWSYDVFLSFRGTDIRKSFISHLYDALTDEGIKAFHDDRELQRGDSICEGLGKGIDKSRFAIVVISKDYATSRWCLEELSVMVDLAVKKRLELIPVFYDIDPSDLKRRSGCFYEALEKHKLRNDLETVGRWRLALAEVGNISGWDSKSRNEDSGLVQEIVEDLCDRLSSHSSVDDTTGLVGMSLHKKNMESLLSMDSVDVRMVGVWGMGGRGKTTIAKYVLDDLSSQFDSSCLLEDVKGDFKQYGKSHLRKEIISKIFPKGRLNAQCISSDAMKRRLCGKKVLLVLDDVDDIQQLQELAGNCEWFGPGSRIIITTRDKRVLDEHGVEHIYEVKPLRPIQALKLFSEHAFKRNHPQEEFRKLSLDFGVVRLTIPSK